MKLVTIKEKNQKASTIYKGLLDFHQLQFHCCNLEPKVLS